MSHQPPIDLLSVTLAAAVRDSQTTRPDGTTTAAVIDGVRLRDSHTFADERGTVVEMFDPRSNWHPDPLVFVYAFTVRPGFVKGWNLHVEHEDRYFILQGELELVLFDPRPESPTRGQVSKLVLSEHRRRLVNVPRNVWHADHNIGDTDVVVVNFPTRPYDHANPDKYRLPIDTPLIPYSFAGARGW